MREIQSKEVRKVMKDAGAVKVSIRQNPFSDGLYNLHVQFKGTGELVMVSSSSVFPADFVTEHAAEFAAMNSVRGSWLIDKQGKLV